MKVLIKFHHHNMVGDLSGVELETLTKVIGKLRNVDDQYLNGRTMFVAHEGDEARVKMPISLLDETTPFISQNVAKSMREGDNMKNRASYVARINDPAITPIEMGKQCDLLANQLYYDSCVTRAEKDTLGYEAGSAEHGTVDFMSETDCHRVHADGRYERIALEAGRT